MSKINVSDLTFYYDGSADNIFEHVNFAIDTDWKLGFIGRNGRGKTTFLRLLMGLEEYRGKITSPVEFDYFPFEVSNPGKSTMEVVMGTAPDVEFWMVCRELNELGVVDDIWERPFESLSHGEQTKVLLGILFARENHFLLIDEPTNHLDMETRQRASEYLNKKKGFILVSHDRCFLNGCIDHVLSINKTNIEVVQGNFDSWWENKQMQDAYELAENVRLQKDIHRLKEAARQSKRWADNVESTKIGAKSFKYEKCIDTRAFVGEKSKRMQQRRKNLERRQTRELEEKEGLLKNIEQTDDIHIRPLQWHKELLVEVSNLSLSYQEMCIGMEQSMTAGGRRSREIVRDINFQVKRGDRLFLAGRNGCGKSSIIKKILGADISSTGLISSPQGLVISYVAQDADRLSGKLKDYIQTHGYDETLFKQFLRKMDFTREQFEKRMEEYSAGQKKKVLLAGSMCEQAHLYIWDEPLNYIDIYSRMQLEALILRDAPTMILVEHDEEFREKVATKIVKCYT